MSTLFGLAWEGIEAKWIVKDSTDTPGWRVTAAVEVTYGTGSGSDRTQNEDFTISDQRTELEIALVALNL